MTFPNKTGELSPTRIAPETMLAMPVGLVSPLWGMFSGAALTGVAWWWATQWMRPPVAEGVLPGMATPGALLAEPIPEPASETVPEAIVEADLPPMGIGGESAPIPPAALFAEASEPAASAPAEPVALAPAEKPEIPAVQAPVEEPQAPLASASVEKPAESEASVAFAATEEPAPVIEPGLAPPQAEAEAAAPTPEPTPVLEAAPKPKRTYKPRAPKAKPADPTEST
jgi:hypothetical protein